MFEQLENTSLALWVSESLWAYPGLLSVHIIGLAVVVGLLTIGDLRLVGMFNDMDTKVILSINKVAAIGLVVNVLSGFMLFSSQASVFVQSKPFLIKIAAILVGIILASIIHIRLRNSKPNQVAGSTKLLAVFSLLSWLTAIAAGRLIAYL